jgi:homoserine dehydrogenase
VVGQGGHFRIGLIGFGSVNRALARILIARRAEIEARHGLTFQVNLIATARRGAWIEPEGIDLECALRDGWSGGGPTTQAIRTAPLDLVFEGTPLDPRAGEPAASHLRAALERGVSAVSANKGPIAWAARELAALARATGAGFRFESAVADCMPVFDLIEVALPVGRVEAFRGVLNSTSNHVLQALARGESAEAAVAEAQRRGIAEADPAHDLDGWDQAVKAVIVANVLLGRDLKPPEVLRVPLSKVDVGWLRSEHRSGRSVRLAASGAREGPVRVEPLSLEPGSFLASLTGTSLGMTIETDLAGILNVASVEAGVEQTAYGMLSDMMAIAAGRLLVPSPLWDPPGPPWAAPGAASSRADRAAVRSRAPGTLRGLRRESAGSSSCGSPADEPRRDPAKGRSSRPASLRGSSPSAPPRKRRRRR